MAASFEIRDPIYGFITFDDWEKSIINSQPFQRLRRIQQLALTNYIYPSANHNRFEHSLGVMHLASLMFDAIIGDERNVKLLEDELGYNRAGLLKIKKLIRLAALLHDVGHPPFSHTGEELFPINPGNKKHYKHETYSTAIITNLLKDLIENHPTNTSNYDIKAEEVAALIDGNTSVLKSKIFWKVLIASQLDADKGDYLLRDSHHIGVRYGLYDYNRLLNTLALGKKPENEGGEIVLGVREDGWHVAESVILARYQMFTQVYFHKARRIYDYHLKKALLEIFNTEVFPTPEKIVEYLKFDDYRIWEMIKSKNSKHCNVILNRNHMRLVLQTKENDPNEMHETLNEKSEILKQAGIEYFIDLSNSAWYKTEVLANEIMVISKSEEVQPLSMYSEIVKKMGVINQSRLYVWPNDRIKAKELINE